MNKMSGNNGWLSNNYIYYIVQNINTPNREVQWNASTSKNPIAHILHENIHISFINMCISIVLKHITMSYFSIHFQINWWFKNVNENVC